MTKVILVADSAFSVAETKLHNKKVPHLQHSATLVSF